jgi:hypothetical protein
VQEVASVEVVVGESRALVVLTSPHGTRENFAVHGRRMATEFFRMIFF